MPATDRAQFYNTFGRPIAKVFFGAVVVYQGTYWLWLKLEMEEIKAKKQNQLASLEAQIRETQRQSSKSMTTS